VGAGARKTKIIKSSRGSRWGSGVKKLPESVPVFVLVAFKETKQFFLFQMIKLKD
jgi:hypothetical protein